MLSRSLSLLSILLLLLSATLAHAAFSEAHLARSFPPPPILASAGVAINASNGAVLAARNPHLRLPMASTTKIMTAVVALRNGHLNDRIVVPAAAFDFESDATVMGLHPGNVVTLRDLLYGLMLPSGADAANAIAIHYGGSEAGFVALMNRQAQQLGMKDTHFVNAHGLTAHNHYTSAYDLALLARFAASMPDLMKVAATRTYWWNGRVLVNLNRVLFWYPGVDGVKPGYTDDAGLCQVLDAQRNGRHVIVVLLHTPNLDTDARNLLNFALRDFSWVQSRIPGDNPAWVQSGKDAAGSYYYFPGAGHYLRGAFWTGYIADGGLSALGFPRTEPLDEQGRRVQYFQNGALAQDPHNGRVTRLAIGLTPLPTATVPNTPSPTPLPSATPSGTPVEGTVVLTTRTVTVTNTPRPRLTPTPTPHPPAVTPTPTPTGPLAVARVFQTYLRTHAAALGAVASRMQYIRGYRVQLFSYGALAYRDQSRTLSLLPLGDHLLSARHYLPRHPGNSYPAGFASQSVQRLIGWVDP